MNDLEKDISKAYKMKREIIFKGKRKDNGEWVEGSLIQLNSGICYITKNIHGLHLPLDGKLICEFTHKVISESVGQYTGYKDKNNKKIWENSEVGYKALGSYFKGKVVWCKANLTWVVDAKDGDGLRQRPFLAHINNLELLKG